MQQRPQSPPTTNVTHSKQPELTSPRSRWASVARRLRGVGRRGEGGRPNGPARLLDNTPILSINQSISVTNRFLHGRPRGSPFGLRRPGPRGPRLAAGYVHQTTRPRGLQAAASRPVFGNRTGREHAPPVRKYVVRYFNEPTVKLKITYFVQTYVVKARVCT